MLLKLRIMQPILQDVLHNLASYFGIFSLVRDSLVVPQYFEIRLLFFQLSSVFGSSDVTCNAWWSIHIITQILFWRCLSEKCIELRVVPTVMLLLLVRLEFLWIMNRSRMTLIYLPPGRFVFWECFLLALPKFWAQ